MGSLIKELLRLVRSKMASAEGRCCCRREWTASASLHLTPSEAVCLSLCSYRAIQHRFRVSNFIQISIGDERRFVTIEPLSQGDRAFNPTPSGTC